MRKVIRETEPIPKWYCISHPIAGYAANVCYPFGIHYIVMFFRWLYISIKTSSFSHPHDKYCLMCREAYNVGYSHGDRWFQAITEAARVQVKRQQEIINENQKRHETN